MGCFVGRFGSKVVFCQVLAGDRGAYNRAEACIGIRQMESQSWGQFGRMVC